LRNTPVEQPEPVRPVRTLGKVAVIDTLPTGNSALSIVLFNDNTWRYILAEDHKNDPEVFNDHWDTTNIHAYRDVALDSLPEASVIRLVDSLESYHYPYIGRITSRYGPRKGRAHQGLDLGLKTGDPIYATFDGKVRISKAAGDYGNLIVIRHNNGLETYYAHLSQRDVEVGDWVVAGQQIGLGGSTGRSTGPHLHYEVRYKGQSFDPERLIDFSNGNLRRDELLLKRRHFSIYSKFEQDFGDEEEVAKQEEAERKAAAAVQYHTIRSGDTLGAIARKYGTSVSRICQLNGIKSTTILSIGRRLRVR
jgi:murein DD-endopeptidase MepM/ murein hydrolase activator NlpD